MILVSAEVEFTLELRAGWNMVSLPVVPKDASAASVLRGVGFYQLVTLGGVRYIASTEFEVGRVYWLLVLQDVNVTVAWIPVDSLNLTLTPGWRIVGEPYSTLQAADVFPGFFQLVTWTKTSYTSVTAFEPVKGYWALVLSETELSLSP